LLAVDLPNPSEAKLPPVNSRRARKSNLALFASEVVRELNGRCVLREVEVGDGLEKAPIVSAMVEVAKTTLDASVDGVLLSLVPCWIAERKTATEPQEEAYVSL
jgi:hypothetical protein